jgi:hypothetical protein
LKLYRNWDLEVRVRIPVQVQIFAL